jgi:hypothetical protein
MEILFPCTNDWFGGVDTRLGFALVTLKVKLVVTEEGCGSATVTEIV